MTYIPLQSGQDVATSLVGGHIQLAILPPGAVLPFLESKEVRPLAAITQDRWSELPNTPTMKELGYDIDITGWMGLGSPRGVPKDRLGLINSAFKRAHSDPEVKGTMEKLGIYAPYISGEETKAIFQKMAQEWKPAIDAIKTKEPKK